MKYFVSLFVLLIGLNPLFCQDSTSTSIDTFAWSIDIEDVVVTAQYAPTDSRSVVYPVRRITRESIERRGVNNLEQLLSQELNIRISQDLILGSSVKLQGISGQNIKIMIDGVPVIGRVGDDIDLSQIQLDNIERVEVVEGPLSVNYGTNALGGAINLITKKSQLNRFHGELRSQLESIDRSSISLLGGMRITPKILLQLNGAYKQQAGFNTTTSEASRSYEWNPKTQWSGGGMLRFQPQASQDWVYTFNQFEEDIDNLGEMRRPAFKPYAFDDYYSTTRQDHSLQYNGEWKDQYFVNTTIAYNHFKRQKNSYRFEFDEEQQTLLDASAQDTTRFNAFVFRPVFARQNNNTAINFEIGADINYENGYGKKIVDTLSDDEHFTYLVDAALFGVLKYRPTTHWTIQLGARAAYNSRYKPPVIPSLNVLYRPNTHWSFRLAYAKGFRSPSLKELFYYFVDTNHFIIGNKGLKAETSDNFQVAIGWEKTVKNHSFKINLNSYYNNIKNKIGLYDFVEQDGKLVPAASLGTSTTEYAYFNQSEYSSLGTNLRLEWAYKNLKAQLGFAPIGQYNPLSATKSAISKYTFAYETNGGLTYTIPKWNWSTSFYIRNNDKLIRYYLDYDDEGNEITKQSIQKGYQLADWSTSKTIWKNKIQVTFGIQNVFDVTRVDISNSTGGAHGGSANSVPISVGRNYFGRLVIKL